MDEWMVGTAFSLLKHDMPKSWDFMCVFLMVGGVGSSGIALLGKTIDGWHEQ